MQRRFIFLLAILGLNFAIVFCQDNSPSQQKIVTAIEVRGNKSISTNTIISKMKIQRGSVFQENLLNEDLKRLYLLGYFSDIKITTEDYKEGVKIVIEVIERPIIEKISFSGFKHIRMREEKLKENLKSKENQYLDYPTLKEDLETLKKLYEKRGFSEVKLDYKFEIDSSTNKAKILFVAEEGKRTKIKKVVFRGNKVFSSRRLMKLIKSRPAWLLNPGILKEETLQEDIKKIKSFYERQGYMDVKISYQIQSHRRRPELLLVIINIQEGRKYLVGTINIKGNKDISEEEILSRIKECSPGKVFSQEAMREDINNILGLYFDRGYIMAQVEEVASLNPNTQKIDITYNIVEKEVVYVDRIKIKGNIKTKDIVIRRELRIMPGERFDGDKLRRSKERIQNLGFFEEVSYDTEDTSVPNRKDLIVEVKETKTGMLSFGGGYSSVEEFIGFVEIAQKNFDWKNFPYFTGDGQDLRFRASWGTVSNQLELSFTEPWLFDYPISFGFDAYRRQQERETDIGYAYDSKTTGGDIRLGKEISEYIRMDTMYRYDIVEISNIEERASSDLKAEAGKNKISSLQLGVSFDNRDNIFDPHRGSYLSGSLELAGGIFGGDKDFWKFLGRASHYFGLMRKSVLEVRARAGLADVYGDTSRVPIYERFFAGGAYTVRGYHERKLGPIDAVSKDPIGGNAMLIGNIEYLYPIFDFLKFALFYDSGYVWKKYRDIDLNDIKSSFGFGLRLKTPLGPFLLDYGIPLDKEPGEEKKSRGRFHFSMSHGF